MQLRSMKAANKDANSGQSDAETPLDTKKKKNVKNDGPPSPCNSTGPAHIFSASKNGELSSILEGSDWSTVYSFIDLSAQNASTSVSRVSQSSALGSPKMAAPSRQQVIDGEVQSSRAKRSLSAALSEASLPTPIMSASPSPTRGVRLSLDNIRKWLGGSKRIQSDPLAESARKRRCATESDDSIIVVDDSPVNTPRKRACVHTPPAVPTKLAIKTPIFISQAAQAVVRERSKIPPQIDPVVNITPTEEEEESDEASLPPWKRPLVSHKIPPIFIQTVLNIISLIQLLKEAVGEGKFVARAVGDAGVRIQCRDMESYEKAIKATMAAGLYGHTHQGRSERGFRVVIKGLYSELSAQWVRDELAKLGFVTRFACFLRHRFTGKPMRICEVELPPHPANKHEEILGLRKLSTMEVTVERKRRSRNVVICHRCQRVGHSKNYCQNPFRCMKCAGDHPTTSCTKPRDQPAKCANCSEAHVSVYGGCKVLKEARNRLLVNKITKLDKEMLAKRKSEKVADKKKIIFYRDGMLSPSIRRIWLGPDAKRNPAELHLERLQQKRRLELAQVAISDDNNKGLNTPIFRPPIPVKESAKRLPAGVNKMTKTKIDNNKNKIILKASNDQTKKSKALTPKTVHKKQYQKQAEEMETADEEPCAVINVERNVDARAKIVGLMSEIGRNTVASIPDLTSASDEVFYSWVRSSVESCLQLLNGLAAMRMP